jgi:endonuclease/exonuclease/phosphatase family metal-dependent hydrolase
MSSESSLPATSFKLCLTAIGKPRTIVEVSQEETLQDLYDTAIKTFYATEPQAVVSLQSGFPQQQLDNSATTTVQSVLSDNERVSVIRIQNKTKMPEGIFLSTVGSSDSHRPIKRQRLASNENRIRILSWNIAECRPSHDAPSDDFDCEAAILQQILLHDAQILCLQECPAKSWQPPSLLNSYALVGGAPSHCGTTQLWIHKSLFHQRVVSNPPSVAALVLVGNQSIGVSSSHLAPFKQNASLRLEQARDLVQTLSKATPNFIMAGDFNMRQAEDVQIEHLCIQDVFKVAKSPKTANFTWNSLENKYHGPDAFGFKCRFDRIYVSYDGSQPELTLMGNQMQVVAHGSREHKFYLSDHYGMLCTVQVPP